MQHPDGTRRRNIPTKEGEIMTGTTNGSTTVLSPGEAFALGDVLNAITQKRTIRWLDQEGTIRTGELRSLVRGPNDFASAQFGTDVRDMHVWITAGVVETTESVAHLVKMLPEGGMEIIEVSP
jgi:hypothetical protein